MLDDPNKAPWGPLDGSPPKQDGLVVQREAESWGLPLPMFFLIPFSSDSHRRFGASSWFRLSLSLSPLYLLFASPSLLFFSPFSPFSFFLYPFSLSFFFLSPLSLLPFFFFLYPVRRIKYYTRTREYTGRACVEYSRIFQNL